MDYTNENIDEATRMKLCSIEEHFINMRASGQTVREIARKLRKSDHTISDLNKKYFRRVKELQKEKLEVLQKKMFEQKQSRLDFFTEQLLIVKNEIANKKISLNYEELVTLAIKISTALNKCERDMLINDLLGSKENISTDVSIPPNPVEDPPHRVEDPPHRVEDPPRRATNGAGNNSHNLSENNGVTSEIKNSGNTATKNKKSKESQKTDDNSKKQNSKSIKKESKPKENKQKVDKHEEKKPKESKQEENKPDKNMNADLPPRTRADFYRRVLNNKTKAPT